MLHKTRGIVFKTTDYSESSVIVQVFTEKFGMQSYLINGVKKPKAKIRQNMLQPLHLLEMVVYHKPTGNIQRAAEIRNAPVFQTIPYSIVKSSAALFLTEVLYKSIRPQGADEQLFDFVFHAVSLLDKTEHGLHLFHILFLIRLTKYLGFYPQIPKAGEVYFDLKEGSFTSVIPPPPYGLDLEETYWWTTLLNTKFENLHLLKITAAARKALLRNVLRYFQQHIDNFNEIRSHLILEEVLD